MRNRTALAGLALLSANALSSQTPDALPHFEAAVIKPSKVADGSISNSFDNSGRFTATNTSLKLFILIAYQVREIEGGPAWMDSATFDITAKPETAANKDQGRLMLRALLADRFQLKFHMETRELPILQLVVAKNSPHLAEGKDKFDSMSGRPGILTGTAATMKHLAGNLSSVLGRQVFDKTGLPGYYDFKLEFTPEGTPPDRTTGPSLYTALQEQLGLKVESAKGPVEILVIDHAEKPSEN